MKTNTKQIITIGAIIMVLLSTVLLSRISGYNACKETPEYKAGVVVITKEEAEKKIEEAEVSIEANEKIVAEAEAFLMRK